MLCNWSFVSRITKNVIKLNVKSFVDKIDRLLIWKKNSIPYCDLNFNSLNANT